MKKYFILFLFLFSNIFLFAQSFTTIPGTDGLSKATAYQIWTKEHLIELGDSILNSYDPNFSTWHFGKHFRLMNDIKDPMTLGLAPFRGHFHGSGKKIFVAITYNYPTNPYSCLFGGLYSNASIDSLIVDGYVNDGLAGIVAAVMNSIISNCISNVIITAHPNANSPAAITYQNSGTIINCINNGDITGVDNVGGIAGDNQSGTIINCINTGKITATNSGSAPNGCSGVGGIAAYHKNNISNCINLGTVEGQNNVGGIVGWASPLGNTASQITNCVNYGYVKGTNAVGGIVGISYNNIPIISNCVNAGVVEGESDVGSITGKE